MYVDSPLEYCPREGCYVLLDQTQGQCAEEHRCTGSAAECPLRRYFSGRDFAATGESSTEEEPRS